MTDSESGSSSLSFYNESEESLSSLREDDSEILNGCYENEPVYTEAELTQIKSDSETSSSEEELDSSRLENLHWCSCECCVIFSPMLLEECKCCKENVNLLANKLAGIKCITHNEDFKLLCLNKTVLETACIRQRRTENKFTDLKKFSNK